MSFRVKFVSDWNWIVNVMYDVWDMFVNDEWYKMVIETCVWYELL